MSALPWPQQLDVALVTALCLEGDRPLSGLTRASLRGPPGGRPSLSVGHTPGPSRGECGAGTVAGRPKSWAESEPASGGSGVSTAQRCVQRWAWRVDLLPGWPEQEGRRGPRDLVAVPGAGGKQGSVSRAQRAGAGQWPGERCGPAWSQRPRPVRLCRAQTLQGCAFGWARRPSLRGVAVGWGQTAGAGTACRTIQRLLRESLLRRWSPGSGGDPGTLGCIRAALDAGSPPW